MSENTKNSEEVVRIAMNIIFKRNKKWLFFDLLPKVCFFFSVKMKIRWKKKSKLCYFEMTFFFVAKNIAEIEYVIGSDLPNKCTCGKKNLNMSFLRRRSVFFLYTCNVSLNCVARVRTFPLFLIHKFFISKLSLSQKSFV